MGRTSMNMSSRGQSNSGLAKPRALCDYAEVSAVSSYLITSSLMSLLDGAVSHPAGFLTARSTLIF